MYHNLLLYMSGVNHLQRYFTSSYWLGFGCQINYPLFALLSITNIYTSTHCIKQCDFCYMYTNKNLTPWFYDILHDIYYIVTFFNPLSDISTLSEFVFIINPLSRLQVTHLVRIHTSLVFCPMPVLCIVYIVHNLARNALFCHRGFPVVLRMSVPPLTLTVLWYGWGFQLSAHLRRSLFASFDGQVSIDFSMPVQLASIFHLVWMDKVRVSQAWLEGMQAKQVQVLHGKLYSSVRGPSGNKKACADLQESSLQVVIPNLSKIIKNLT